MSDVFWHIVPSPDDTESIRNLELPPKLWHVQHNQSRSINLREGGFEARDPYLDIRTCEALKTEAAKHFVWKTRQWDSGFISAFDDQTHAANWADRMRSRGKEPVVIYELDTSKLPPRTRILKSTPLCSRFGISHKWMEHEWIFHQRIPASCIIRKYCPWYNYERTFQPTLSSTALADVLLGAEWLPPSSTGGPRPPSPGRTEEDQDSLDDLTDRMNGLDLRNATGGPNGITPDADGLAQEEEEDSGPEPTDDGPRDSALAHKGDVDANPIVFDTLAANDPVRTDPGTDSGLTNDAPNTHDAETQTEDILDLTPSIDTSDSENSVDEKTTGTQLSGETVVANESVPEGEEVLDLIPKDDSPKANSGGAVQQKVIWQVNNKVLETTKASLSVVVQVEIRAADEIQV